MVRKKTVNKKAPKPQKKAETKKKTMSKKAETKKTKPRKAPAETMTETETRSISADERHRMIEEAAYYRALERGDDGQPQSDWAEAEAAIDAMLIEEGLQVAS